MNVVAAYKNYADSAARHENLCQFIKRRREQAEMEWPRREPAVWEAFRAASTRYETLRKKRDWELSGLQIDKSYALYDYTNRQILELFQKACQFDWVKPIHAAVYKSSFFQYEIYRRHAMDSIDSKISEPLFRGDIETYALNFADKISRESNYANFIILSGDYPYKSHAPILHAAKEGYAHSHNSALPLVIIQIEQNGKLLRSVARMENNVPIPMEEIQGLLPDWTGFNTYTPTTAEVIGSGLEIPRQPSFRDRIFGAIKRGLGGAKPK